MFDLQLQWTVGVWCRGRGKGSQCLCSFASFGFFFFLAKPCNVDFENGIGGWIRCGTAFDVQRQPYGALERVCKPTRQLVD